jgi:hypothetical protein
MIPIETRVEILASKTIEQNTYLRIANVAGNTDV